MKFLKEESNAYQYKGYTVIQTSSGYRIKDGNNNWVGGEFDTDVDAHKHVDGLKESFLSDYKYVASKSVQDSDGFYTDYTWYKSDDGLNVFVFGDDEVYTPEAGNFDFETENDAEAQEWFDSYNGFAEDIVEEASDTKGDTFCVEDQLEWTDLSGTNYKAIVVSVDDDTVVLDVMPVGGTPVKQSFDLTCDSHGKECIIVDMASDKSDAVYVYPELENLEESTAVADRPLSNLQGTLSSVLLAHKDEVDTLFDKKSAMDFLDRITPEVKDKKYLADVKRAILRGKNSPVEYFYNIILKGDGDGTEKGGKVTKQAKIRKWAKEDLNETWSRGDQVTLWWTDPKWSPTAPCYASCEYVGKSRDGKYRFKSTTYGWEFLLDTVEMTVTTPQGKTFAVDNSSGWIKDVATEGWVARYVPERGDKVTIIGNVYTNSQMTWGTETDEFIGSTGTIEYAGSRYSTFDTIEITLDDGTRVWTAAGYRPVEKNPLKESYNIQFYQIFKNPEKPTDNGKMIAQAGTEEEAKAKGDKLVGKGNYLLKAVCDDGKVRDVDLYSYFNESKPFTEELSDPVYVASSIESLNSYCAGLSDACKKLRDGNMCSYRGYEVEFVDGEYNVYLLESIDESNIPDDVLTESRKLKVGDPVHHVDDSPKSRGYISKIKGSTAIVSTQDGSSVEVPLDKLELDIDESIKGSAENNPLYVIKDSHGNQLSAPNPDDEELWDRVASMEARGRRGLCVVAYTGKKASLKELNEFSDDDVEDDLTHAAVYGGDSKYCKECGAVKEYDEDGFAYCPECCGELDESYYIGDELLRAKQDRLSLELEDAGWTEVDSKLQDGTYWTFFRKMVDGKGQWKAVVIDSVSGDGQIVDVTYGQARGYEPLSSMDVLRKQLGNKLLP